MANIETWEFYEKLNEIVYVTDMDSYDLIYMNRKAREIYGIHSVEEVKGFHILKSIANSKRYLLLSFSIIVCFSTSRAAMTAHSPERSIAILLEYLGQVLKSERVYIFAHSCQLVLKAQSLKFFDMISSMKK